MRRRLSRLRIFFALRQERSSFMNNIAPNASGFYSCVLQSLSNLYRDIIDRHYLARSYMQICAPVKVAPFHVEFPGLRFIASEGPLISRSQNSFPAKIKRHIEPYSLTVVFSNNRSVSFQGPRTAT